MTFFVPLIVTCVSFPNRRILRAQKECTDGRLLTTVALRATHRELKNCGEIMTHTYRGKTSSGIELPMNRLVRGSVLSIVAGLAGSLTGLAAMAADTTGPAAATGAPSELTEIIVTGSTIAQKLDDSPLPVVLLTSEEIAKTGYTSATDLLQNLPGMQSFVTASSSVNGGGGGITTAAVHALPSKYTLVLLDGQRIAGFPLGSVQGSGSGVNLNSIPLDAVERVEILSDGASSLYGADAIAGVVNFILKKDQTDGAAYYNASIPSQPGGGGWSAGLSKGFGDLNTDGWNILVTFSRDVQDSLEASQRAVSSRGAYFPFSANGTSYIFNNRTSNTEPANITLNGGTGNGVSYNPYYSANGNCGQGALAAPLTTAGGTTCRFNYAATVEDIPGYVRDSGLIKATFDLHDAGKVWGEAVISQFDMTSQYAAPAQPFPTSPTVNSAIWNTYVAPYLTANGLTATGATIGYRAVSAGGRTDDWQTKMRHIALGWEGSFFGWDFHASVVDSYGVLTDNLAGGYLDSSQFFSAIASGAYDPIMATGQSSLSTAVLHQQFTQTFSYLTSASVGAQSKIFDLPGGPSVLSLGAEFDRYKNSSWNSQLSLSQSGYSTQPTNSDYPIGGGFGAVPFEADRDNWALLGEWRFPILKDLSVTASGRFDDYAKVHSDWIFGNTADVNPVTGLINQLPSGSQGNTFSDATYELSFRYTPIEMVSFRGSYGTGFRAPNLTDISGPLAYAGSTSGSYPCPFPGSIGCSPGAAQYNLLSGANGQAGPNGLRPESSKQFGFGVRVDPISQLSIALDYWNVKIKNQIESTGIAEQVAFNNPTQYANLFVNPYVTPNGVTSIALQQIPFNGGEADYSGLDLNASYHVDLGFGIFNANWTGTYMLTQHYTNAPGLPELTDLGVLGPDQQVVFRIISNLELSLKTGEWVNTLMTHYKSGYRDIGYTAGDGIVFLAGPNGSLGAPTDFGGLKVPSFTTFDWQTAYNIEKNIRLTGGVRNLADKAPPLSLQTGGGGNQSGYDGRYYDPIGRTFYVRGDVRF
jgi:iron complex outermembrane receptor protein